MSRKNDVGNIPSLYHIFIRLLAAMALLMVLVFLALTFLAMLL